MEERRTTDKTEFETRTPAQITDETEFEARAPGQTLGTTIAQLIDSVLAIIRRINPHHSDETVTEHVAKLEMLKEHAAALDGAASRKASRL